MRRINDIDRGGVEVIGLGSESPSVGGDKRVDGLSANVRRLIFVFVFLSSSLGGC